jgi:hypothetical protein
MHQTKRFRLKNDTSSDEEDEENGAWSENDAVVAFM